MNKFSVKAFRTNSKEVQKAPANVPLAVCSVESQRRQVKATRSVKSVLIEIYAQERTMWKVQWESSQTFTCKLQGNVVSFVIFACSVWNLANLCIILLTKQIRLLKILPQTHPLTCRTRCSYFLAQFSIRGNEPTQKSRQSINLFWAIFTHISAKGKKKEKIYIYI